MKKLVFLIVLLLIPAGLKAQMIGIYGQYYSWNDTVRAYLTFHDTLGLALAEPDSFKVNKYYRGAIVDRDSMVNADTSAALTKLETGIWLYTERAAVATDSIGEYALVIKVFKDGRSAGEARSYQVLRGDGLFPIFDLQIMLDAGDDFYRVLYPDDGSAPKDSIQSYGIWDTNDDGDKLDAADTVLVATRIFYHNNTIQILDSTKTIYHYGVPAP